MSSTPFTEKSPKEKLNDYLCSRDISPIRNTLTKPWEMTSDRTKRLHARKAQQVVNACLEEIAPGRSSQLYSHLHKNISADVDCPLMDALSECYNNAGHWRARRQILSIFADKVSFDDLLKWIPTLKKNRWDIAREHVGEHGRGAPMPPVKNTRLCVKEEKLEHFLTFITSTNIIQDLPFGEKTLKLSSNAKFKIPNVVRSQIPEHIVRQYQGYCKDTGYVPMSRRTLLRVLNVCSASTRKSLQGLDYFSASGAEAFDDLQKVVDRLVDECGKSLSWAKDVSEKLKYAKRYLKGDYKVRSINAM